MSDTPVIVVAPPSTVAAELTTLLTDLIQKKPTTSADALKLMETLEVELLKWLVSELPAAEQKVVMLAKWAVEEVKQVGLTWCVPPPPQKS